MNRSEPFRIYESTSEHLETIQKQQRTSQNFQKSFIIHKNASECFRKTNNVRECLRTFSSVLNQLRIHENASEHPRLSEECLITLWNFSEPFRNYVNVSENLKTLHKVR